MQQLLLHISGVKLTHPFREGQRNPLEVGLPNRLTRLIDNQSPAHTTFKSDLSGQSL
jgi:hypothetical protein